MYHVSQYVQYNYDMIPKSLNIYGETYKVKIVKDKPDAMDCAGKNHSKSKIIYIKEDEAEEMFHTYLHECFHGVFEEGRLNEAVEDGLEEVIIEQLVKFLLKHFTVKPK